ncbi:MAG: YitT family protein [Thermoflexaceae bacterium]|nr:YitT family protein [Thermoflexaceae bacterium]
MKKIIRNSIYIIFGTILYAAGISLFLDPNNLAPGGLVGVSVILSRVLSVSTGTLYFILNIPIVLLGIWKFGVKFMASTTVVIVMNSLLTDFFAGFDAITTEPILAALAGGILIGAGIGIIFRAGTTTGGMDIVIKVIKTKYKHIKTGVLFFTIDMIIVAVSGFVFGNFNIAMYALISVFVSGRVMDTILYGSDEARLIYIISNKYQEISARVLKELDVGVTFLEGKGGYSNENKNVIMCVIRKQLTPRLEDIIKEEDPASFMIISSANEIYGEGYKDILGTRL